MVRGNSASDWGNSGQYMVAYPVNCERYFSIIFLATKEVYDQKDSSFCKLYTIMDDVRSICLLSDESVTN
jgi:hypothetical protein